MRIVKISKPQARRLIIASQGLTTPLENPKNILEHLSYVQIDTISVVARAHHHVFWTRCPKYKPEDLDQLIQDRHAFEYWSHAASFLPMQDYRFSIPLKRSFQKRETSWFPRDEKMMRHVLQRIKKEGALASKDFKNQASTKTGWWDWKPAKKALERLFLEGKLEVSFRKGFQKHYDIPENVIPSHVNTKEPTQKEYARYHIEKTLRHHGLASSREMSYLKRKDVKQLVHQTLLEMVSDKELIELQIAGIEGPYFAHPLTIEETTKSSRKIHILSPFDNLVIQREKMRQFFDFDYQIECYTPAKKREFGYFSLPILEGTKFVGRIDCKADRKTHALMVQSLDGEKGILKNKLKSKIKRKLSDFAKFNGCREIHW